MLATLGLMRIILGCSRVYDLGMTETIKFVKKRAQIVLKGFEFKYVWNQKFFLLKTQNSYLFSIKTHKINSSRYVWYKKLYNKDPKLKINSIKLK